MEEGQSGAEDRRLSEKKQQISALQAQVGALAGIVAATQAQLEQARNELVAKTAAVHRLRSAAASRILRATRAEPSSTSSEASGAVVAARIAVVEANILAAQRSAARRRPPGQQPPARRREADAPLWSPGVL